MALVSLSPAAFAIWATTLGSDTYYLTVQEDGFLEWASFFGFALAAVVFALRAANARREAGLLGAWWPWGVAAFCSLVALEEISWGQRLLGYRPPDPFLAHNFQQELNFHNVLPTDWRKLALLAVIFGYGVVLPVAAAWPPTGSRLARLGVMSPAAPLALAFAASGALYAVYPWKFTGEWVECMVGLGFLGAAVCSDPQPRAGGPSRWLAPLAWTAATLALSAAMVAWTQAQSGRDPGRVAAVEVELELLRADLRHHGIETHCGLHRRLYTWVESEGLGRLRQGRFAALIDAGLPEARAEFFLDPWSSPYWVRDRCEGDRERWIYSLGPNRRRDSTPEAIGGDDVALELP